MNLNRTFISQILFLILLLGCKTDTVAQEKPQLRKTTGPKYWTPYEYNIIHNAPIPEAVWKSNIDWISENFRQYGYDMICNDGWIEAAQTVNENGFITRYNSGWKKGFAEWHQYLADKNLKMGIYYNPMWLTKAAYDQNLPVIGTRYHTRDITGDKKFNDLLYWVDVDKPGAREWIQGYVKYFGALGACFLRADFLSNYENNYGTRKYDQALSWIREAAGNELLVSLAMPNCFNHAATELKHVDMIRIDDDCYDGDWTFVSDRKRGQKKDDWPQFGNAFDGFVAFADIRGNGQMILDGDFMRMNKLANDDERKFLFSLMVMGGSALTIADQYNSIGDHGWIYQNAELNGLNDSAFIASPLSNNQLDATNSSIWIGQTVSGEWIVGLFNREATIQTRSVHFKNNLGIASGRAGHVRDLWLHKDLGSFSETYSVSLSPHECRIVRIQPD